MEIKINKEIRSFNESLFFGLNLRQFICSLLAVGAAIGVYFLSFLQQAFIQEGNIGSRMAMIHHLHTVFRYVMRSRTVLVNAPAFSS